MAADKTGFLRLLSAFANSHRLHRHRRLHLQPEDAAVSQALAEHRCGNGFPEVRLDSGLRIQFPKFSPYRSNLFGSLLLVAQHNQISIGYLILKKFAVIFPVFIKGTDIHDCDCLF